MERQWQWEAAHVIEHSFLAMALEDGSHTLVQMLRCSTNGGVTLSAGAPGDRSVRVFRMERLSRAQLLEMAGDNMGLRKWLGVRGGTHVRMRGMSTRHTQGIPHAEWMWTSGDGREEDVQLSDLILVTTSRMDKGEAEMVCHSKDIVVIDEPLSWPSVVN